MGPIGAPVLAGAWPYIIVATGAWGVWGLFDKRAVGTAAPLVVMTMMALMQGLLGLVYLLALRATHTPLVWQRETVLWTGLAVLTASAAYVAYLNATYAA